MCPTVVPVYGVASDAAPRPAMVMAHGFGAVKEMHLDTFAARFAKAGFAVLVFDYRRLGASDGIPRQEIDPAAQIEDYRNAITWVAAQNGVDSDVVTPTDLALDAYARAGNQSH